MSVEVRKKKISIVVPVYNEQECLQQLYERTAKVMDALKQYETELVFFDDGSTDSSREIIETLCGKDARCKAVFFQKNYGYNKTIFYAVEQAKGDCAVLLHADLQNPPELIPDFVSAWEHGHDVVFGVKSKSRENKLMYGVRTMFYLTMNVVFGMKLIPHATDFELIDKRLKAALKANERSEPFLRDILNRNVKNRKLLYYTQDKRNAGQSNFTIKKYFELALSWIAASPPVLPRRMFWTGVVMGAAGLIEGFAGFLPRISQCGYEALSTALLARFGWLIFSVMLCFGAILCSSALKAADTGGGVQIMEKKRIHY
ncbi:MAG: glycosyltransferase family 2 protein [Clostridia bacterium]|nr:glycosyltransferase family 2 protein [Clostridia bacterium]